MNWFRFYTSSLDNPKIQRLPGELFKSWVNLLSLARLHDGVLPCAADIAFRLRKPQEEVAAILKDLAQRNLLDKREGSYIPHDWNEFQYPSDSSTERSRKSRASKKRHSSHGEETHEDVAGNSNATSNATLQERSCNALEQSRAETEQNTSVSSRASSLEPANGKPAMMMPLPASSDFPKTFAECRSHDPATTPLFVARLAQVTLQAALSDPIGSKHYQRINDRVMAEAVKESYTTGPPGHRLGLLLSRVPAIVISWCQEDS